MRLCLNLPLLVVLSLAALPVSSSAGAPDLTAALAEDRETERLYGAEDTFESSTRSPRPLTQVAENVTVVTAEEIEAMNAHTLAEVLSRVTGVFVEYSAGAYLGGISLAHVQGSGETDFATWSSEERHVLVLVDGLPLNGNEGDPNLYAVPVGAIERIEIVKGPASSAWGSALGGIVSVLTKKTGATALPSGQASLSYGERHFWDGRAEAGGKVGILSYYLYGQSQGGEWGVGEAAYRERAAVAKLAAKPTDALAVSLGVTYARPTLDDLDRKTYGAFFDDARRAVTAQLAVDARLADSLSARVSAYRVATRNWQEASLDAPLDLWGDGSTVLPAGTLFAEQTYENDTRGAQARVVWEGRGRTAVAGVDYSRSEFDFPLTYGEDFGGTDYDAHLSIEKVGVYTNGTLALGPLALTPGLRFDDTNRTGSFVSPSLGAALQAGPRALLRASVARGFTLPALSYLVDNFNMAGNPDLEPEQVWSYQAGAEARLPLAWLKATVFRHEATDSLETELLPEPTPEGVTIRTVNQGHVWRTGVEAEVESARVRGVATKFGGAYVVVEKSGRDRSQEVYQAQAALSFRDAATRAELFGYFTWWDTGEGEGDRNDFLWDLNASRTILARGILGLEVFATVHNVFNGHQYTDEDFKTPERFVEGGARLRF